MDLDFLKRGGATVSLLILLGAGCAPKTAPASGDASGRGFGSDGIEDAVSQDYGIDSRTQAETCEAEGGCDFDKAEIRLEADSDWFEGSGEGENDSR